MGANEIAKRARVALDAARLADGVGDRGERIRRLSECGATGVGQTFCESCGETTAMVPCPRAALYGAACGTDDCGRTSATSRPSTMPSPPSTRPSDATARQSSAFVHKDSETAEGPLRRNGPSSSCLARAGRRWNLPLASVRLRARGARLQQPGDQLSSCPSHSEKKAPWGSAHTAIRPCGKGIGPACTCPPGSFSLCIEASRSSTAK
jgi:hypothetical protein